MFHKIYLCSSSQSSIESEVGSSQSSTRNSVYWKDENVHDDGVPDPRLTSFKPKRKPGFQLGRISRLSVYFCNIVTYIYQKINSRFMNKI